MLKTCLLITFYDEFRYQRNRLMELMDYLKVEIPTLTESDLFDLKVIYNELITNAIIHGNKFDYSKKVELLIEIEGTTITSSIKDEGVGFDHSVLFKTSGNREDIFAENGKGLRLVIALADIVEWNDEGNEVTFYKKFRAMPARKYVSSR